MEDIDLKRIDMPKARYLIRSYRDIALFALGLCEDNIELQGGPFQGMAMAEVTKWRGRLAEIDAKV